MKILKSVSLEHTAMRAIALLSLILDLMLTSSPIAFALQTENGSTPQEPEHVFSIHVEDRFPAKGDLFVVYVKPPYKFCKEVSRKVTQTGAGVIDLQAVHDNGELFEYSLRADTLTHQESSITADISVLGVLDKDKAKCPSNFVPFVQYAPATQAERAKIASTLPLEKIFSKHFSDVLPYDSQHLDRIKQASVDFRFGFDAYEVNYKVCKQVLLKVSQTGAGRFGREAANESLVAYHYWLLPDRVFRGPTGNSSAVAQPSQLLVARYTCAEVSVGCRKRSIQYAQPNTIGKRMRSTVTRTWTLGGGAPLKLSNQSAVNTTMNVQSTA